MSSEVGSDGRACRRCGQEVVANSAQYDVFEGMHYVCFHYEFEHAGDPDVECQAGGCPAAGTGLMSLPLRVDGTNLWQAGNTVIPAILALRQLGCHLTVDGTMLVAKLGNATFCADDQWPCLASSSWPNLGTPGPQLTTSSKRS